MKRFAYIALVALLLVGCTKKEGVCVIPRPQVLEVQRGEFVIGDGCAFYTNVEGEEGDVLRRQVGEAFLVQSSEFRVQREWAGRGVCLLLDEGIPAEGYVLEVTRSSVVVTASTTAGLFYGLQTLAQCVTTERGQVSCPCMHVSDAPRFAYRGMHLDVSRHFFSVAFIKKQLDMMAHYKLNRFHWHLTDGAGWRMEVDGYPLLTEVAAWRVGKWKEWWAGDRHYCTADSEGAYGGYYTKEEMREVVRYAAERHIEVIPEIEMPGHSEEVTAVYPQLGCSGRPYVNGELCPGNEETFAFIERVLTEVMEVFPSKYIHIGGDEANKNAWRTCARCRKRVEEEHLASTDDLQGYMMRRVERFLKAHGREMIGWDEVAEDGLSNDAVVMAWSNEGVGQRIADGGHKVVMTPGAYCYLDMYQANPMREEAAIGGYLPIAQCYSFDPVSDSLSGGVKENVWGVQANVWTEYMPNEEHTEYMIYPRLLALAEVAWTPQPLREWEDFKVRVNKHVKTLQARGYNAFGLSDEPQITQEMLLAEHKVRLTMSSERTPIEIRYTTDGSEPNATSTIYTRPLELSNGVLLQAALFEGGRQVGPVVKHYYGFHKAVGKLITYNNGGYGSAYAAGGDEALVDGIVGSYTYTDGHWQGFSENDMDVTIDLGEVQMVHNVSATFMQLTGPWIWLPQEVVINASVDGKDFVPLAVVTNDVSPTQEGLILQPFGWEGERPMRYIRYRAKSRGVEHGWMFVDEIVVN